MECLDENEKTHFDKVNHLEKQLIILNPDKILDRGYSIPFDQNGKIIRLPSQIDVGDIFKLKMAKGYMSAKKASD